MNNSNPNRYDPKVYAALRHAIKLMDHQTREFVIGLERAKPEAWNDLAAVAYDYGDVATIYAIRVVWDLLNFKQKHDIRKVGREIEASAKQE